MKRIKYLLVALMMFVVGATTAFASVTTYVSGPSSITPGQQFNVTIGLNGGVNIYGVQAAFNYDSDKLELIGSSGASGFALTLGSNLVVDTAAPQNGNFAIATLTFKAKDTFAIGTSANVSLSSVVAGDGENDIPGTNGSLSIAMTAPKSSNNYLSNLTVDKGEIRFNKNTTNYSIVVNNDVKSVNITATAEDSKATVSGIGQKNLNVYANTFYITVTAENGAKKSYAITINRKDEDGNAYKLSDDNALSSLIIEGYEIDFDKDTFEYEINVDENVNSINITANAANGKAKVEIDNPEELVIGENIITIRVTSENGEERSYIVKVFKKENVKIDKDEVDNVPKIEKEESNVGYLVTIIIESITILGLIGYIIYDKKFKK